MRDELSKRFVEHAISSGFENCEIILISDVDG